MKKVIGSAKYGKNDFIIDDEDSYIFDEWKPTIVTNGSGTFYLQLIKIEGPIRMITTLHRLIMNCPSDMVVDHINGNTLDNRKENLRICTQQQNGWNRSKTKTRKCASQYIGVTWVKSVQKWQAYLGDTYLGRFEDEVQAAKAYDTESKKVYGEYGKLNFPDSDEEVVGVIRKKKLSQFRGVYPDGKTGKWLCSCMVNGKRYKGGKLFDCEEDAAKRYDEMIIEHGGNVKRLNFPELINNVAKESQNV